MVLDLLVPPCKRDEGQPIDGTWRREGTYNIKYVVAPV